MSTPLDTNTKNLQLILEVLKELNSTLTEERVVEIIRENSQTIEYGTELPEGEKSTGDVFLLQGSTSSDKILSISEMTYSESGSQVGQFTDIAAVYNESSGIMKICCQCDSYIQAGEDYYIDIVLNNINIGRKLMGGTIYYDKSSCSAISNISVAVNNRISILSSDSIEADVPLNIVLYFI